MEEQQTISKYSEKGYAICGDTPKTTKTKVLQR